MLSQAWGSWAVVNFVFLWAVDIAEAGEGNGIGRATNYLITTTDIRSAFSAVVEREYLMECSPLKL